MKDEFTPLINAMKTASAAGLMQVAVNLNDRAEPLVPVHSTALRQSMYEERRGDSVYAITGEGAPGGRAGANVGEYVSAQYYKDLRHRGTAGVELLSLAALHRDAVTAKAQHQRTLKNGKVVNVNTRSGKRTAGTGDRNLYNRAYRLAIKRGEIAKTGAPMWYDRIAEREDFLDESAEIMVGFWDAQ